MRPYRRASMPGCSQVREVTTLGDIVTCRLIIIPSSSSRIFIIFQVSYRPVRSIPIFHTISTPNDTVREALNTGRLLIILTRYLFLRTNPACGL